MTSSAPGFAKNVPEITVSDASEAPRSSAGIVPVPR